MYHSKLIDLMIYFVIQNRWSLKLQTSCRRARGDYWRVTEQYRRVIDQLQATIDESFFFESFFTFIKHDFQKGTKFCRSDPSFKSNILKSLYVKSELLRMLNYTITCLCILYTSSTTQRQLETYIEDTLDKQHQHYECDHVTFLRNNFRRAASYQTCQRCQPFHQL